MKCPGCGEDAKPGSKFCTNCGAPLGNRTVQMSQVPPPPPLVTPAQPPTTPMPAIAPGPSVPGGRRTAWIIMAIIIGILIFGGIVGGIIAWQVAAGNRTVADVEKVELTRSDGKALDLEKVPLDVGLTLKTTFHARYKQGGKATLKLSVHDSAGEQIVGDSFTVQSEDEAQTTKIEFRMTESTGKPLEAKAELRVTRNNNTLEDSDTLAYTAVTGQGKEAQLADAKKRASDKLDEAAKAVEVASGQGISVGDLFARLDKARKDLGKATTVKEANDAYDVAVSVINECKSRQTAQKNDQHAMEVCRDNQTRLREAIVAFNAANGNYPDNLSMLSTQGYLPSLPVCPSGGTYTYNVNYSVTPETLAVSCSVHGTLLPGI